MPTPEPTYTVTLTAAELASLRAFLDYAGGAPDSLYAALDAAKPIAEEHGAHHDRSCACWQRRPDCGCYLWDQDCPHFTPPTDDGPWTTERIREAFIYDGGEAEYHDPINGAREQRRMAGAIFDAWLAAHDAEVRRQRPITDADESDRQQIEAWQDIATHPFFEDCYAADGTLIGAMLAKLTAITEAPFTDAQVYAAWRAGAAVLGDHEPPDELDLRAVRAALEAARDA